MAIVRVAPGTQARAEDVQQIIDWLQGSRRNTAPVSLTGYSGLSYALTVLNRDTTYGLAFQVKNASDDRQMFSISHAGVEIIPRTPTGSFFRLRNYANNANILEVTDTGVSLSGDAISTVTAAQTLSNKTLVTPILQGAQVTNYADVFQQPSAPAQPVDGRLRVYGIVADDFLRYSTETDPEKVLVTTDDPQTLSNKTIIHGHMTDMHMHDHLDGIVATGDAAAPSSGNLRLYFFTGGMIRTRDSAGVIREQVDTTSAQTLASKTLTAPVMTIPRVQDYMDVDQIATPAAPGASRYRIYGKTGTTTLNYRAGAAGPERTLVDTDTTQTLSAKTITTPIVTGLALQDFADITQIATPSAPAAGTARLYSKTGTTMLHFRIGPAGSERTLVDADSPQVLTNKSLSVTTLNEVTNQSQIISNFADWVIGYNPGAPIANRARMWMNVDNNVYYVLPDGSTRRLATVEPITTQESFLRSFMFMGG